MLFRKRGTASSILAIALLVAIMASMNTIVNHINSQTEALGGLLNIGGTYLILSANSTSITDSKIDADLASQLSNATYVKYVLPQKILTANITTKSSNNTIKIRAIEDISNYLKLKRAYVNGTTAKSKTEANMGEILARASAINLQDELNLTIGNNILKVKVVGIFRTQTEIDADLIVPMEASNKLAEDSAGISIIEFALKENINSEDALNRIIQQLPKDVKIVKAQQLKEFMQEMNMQTITFLNMWSLIVYATVAAASYIIATRLITESHYELTMLRALGAAKRRLFTLVLTFAVSTALLGSILGIAIGIAGAQTSSTIFRWLWPSVQITPFLEPAQALQILLLTLASSTIGCICPVAKSARKIYMEQL